MQEMGISRRAALAGSAAALVVGAALPTMTKASADLPSGDDADLFRKVAHFHKCKVAADAYQAECERLESMAPAHLRGRRYMQTEIVKDGQRHTVTDHELASIYGVTIFDLKDLPPGHPAYKPAQRLATLKRQRRQWADSVGLGVLESDDNFDAIYGPKSDAEIDVMMTPAQTPEGFRAKLEVYQYWVGYMGEVYEDAQPVLLDECSRLIGRATA